MLRLFPAATLLILVAPVLAGLAGILAPAFDYFPALGHTAPSLQPFRDLAAAPGLGRSLLLSLTTGLAATAASFTIVIVFVAGWRGSRVFLMLERLVSPLLSIPHAAAAFGLAFLIAPAGFLARLLSPWATGWQRPPDLLIVQDRFGLAMTSCLILKETPFLFLVTLAALPQSRAGDAARVSASLGYGRLLGFLHGILPALYPQIRLATLAALAFATSVVDVAIILGPTTPPPLAVRILAWQADPDLDMRLLAAAGAVLQLGVTAVALAVWVVGERLARFLTRRLARLGWRGRPDKLVRALAAALMAACAAAVLAGIGLLAAWSLAATWRFPEAIPSAWSLRTWPRTIADLALPVANTLALGAASSIAAVVLALGLLEFQARTGRGGSIRLLYVPLLVPQVSFLFGMAVLFAALRLDGGFPAVLVAHLVFVLPYVLLSLAEPWRSWDPRYGRVAQSLGRGPDSVFWLVRLPMLARAVFTAAAIGFAVSVGLYLPTLLIGSGRWPTVTTETVSLASGGYPSLIGATALVQALLPFLGFVTAALLFEALAPGRNSRVRAG